MPRNRRPVPKEEKRAALVGAAAELFVADGYDAASMSRIARHAGVTATTLYWYFADKDELLVAVADAYLQMLQAEHAAQMDRPLPQQMMWLIERLRPVKHLVATVHDRLTVSEAVRIWHEQFHYAVEQLVHDQLPGRIPDDRFAAEAAAATFALEGAITHDLDDTTSLQLCEIVVAQLRHAAETTPTA